MRVTSARRRQPVLAALGLLVSSASWAVASPTYTITDLGTLPGQSASVATGINDQGQVVGVSGNGIDAVSGNAWPRVVPGHNPGLSSFLYSGGQMTQINPIGGSPAAAINDAGQVVGGLNTSINNSGQYVSGTGLVSGGMTTPLGNFSPFAINDSGEMAGSVLPNGVFAPSDPAVSQGGHVTDLMQSLGLQGVGGQAYAINNAGDVLFYYQDQGGNPHYMIYSHDGHLTKAAEGPIVGPGGPGLPAALNDLGQVVGDNFLYSNGVNYMLPSLIPATSGWGPHLLALAINNAGQIVGAGAIDGQQHAFLMTPDSPQQVPEPSTLATLGLASAWYILRRRRGD